MKALKVILIVLVVIVAGYSAWMATLPAHFTMERSAVFDTSPQNAFNKVNDLTTWNQWSPWSLMDSTQTMEFSDPASGEGAYYTWEGDITKKGKYTNATVVENESIDFTMEFEGMGNAGGYWKFEAVEDGKTKVIWGYEQDFGFFDRIGNLFIEGALGPQFEEGLENLKPIAEAAPAAKTYDITMVETTGTPYYGITQKLSFDELSSEVFGKNYGAIGEYLGKDMANISGPVFAIYDEYNEAEQTTLVTFGIPVASELEGTEEIVAGTTYAGTAIKTEFWGPYEQTGDAHAAMAKYIADNGLTMVGAPWESYVTDPSMESDPQKWLTEVYYPVMPAQTEEM